MAALPPFARQQLEALRREYTNGEITRKGYRLKVARVLGPFASDECYDPSNDGLLEAIALRDHVASTPKELMFLKDDVVTILGRLPNNMFKGECQGFAGTLHGDSIRFLSIPWWERTSPQTAPIPIPSHAGKASASTSSSPLLHALDGSSSSASRVSSSPKNRIITSRARAQMEDEERHRYVVNPGPLSYERAPMYDAAVESSKEKKERKSAPKDDTVPVMMREPSSSRRGANRDTVIEVETPTKRSMAQDTGTILRSGSAAAAAAAEKRAESGDSEVLTKKSSKEKEAKEEKVKEKSKDKEAKEEKASKKSKELKDTVEPLKDSSSGKKERKEKEEKESKSKDKEDKESRSKDKEEKESKSKDKEEKESKSKDKDEKESKSKDKEEKETKSKDKESRSKDKEKSKDKEEKSKDKEEKSKDKSSKEKEKEKEKEADKDDADKKKKHKRTKSEKEDTSSSSKKDDDSSISSKEDEAERKARRKAKRPDTTVKLPARKDEAATAVAIRDHIAENDNELMFLQGELITILERRGNGKYLGRCEGAEGIFYEQDVVLEGPNRAILSPEVQRSFDATFSANPREADQMAADFAHMTLVRNAGPAADKKQLEEAAVVRGQVLAALRRKRSASDEQLQFFRRTMSRINIKQKYRKIERIGSGSFGEVYKALDQETGEIVAIKIIDLEDRKDDLMELQMEIAFMAQFVSTHITRYFGSYIVERQLWIIMEHLAGGSIFDILKSGPLDERCIAIIMREVLKGLDYLHGQRKLHRDIKAANILLSERGDVKLCDFGVAGQLTDSLTRKNTFTGTPAWMAPEIILNHGYDMRADIWSLGITAIECADGVPPNAQMHPMRMLYLIVSNPAPSLQSPGHSANFKDFIAQCLSKDPKKRATARQLLEHPFIKRAGDTSILTEVIARYQQWLATHGDSKDNDDTSSVESVEHSKSWDFT